jgi:hypothetical protein
MKTLLLFLGLIFWHSASASVVKRQSGIWISLNILVYCSMIFTGDIASAFEGMDLGGLEGMFDQWIANGVFSGGTVSIS